MEEEASQELINKRMEKFSFTAFQKNILTWDAYIYQFQKVCMVKGLGGIGPRTDTAKRDLLLAYVGAEHLQAVRNFFYPKDLDSCSYEEIKTGFQKLYKPSVTIFAARMAFEKANRKVSETFTEYANRLRELSTACDYGNTLDERLRDRFAAGVGHQNLESEIRVRWPDGKTSSTEILSFHQVLELAIAMERAETETRNQPTRIATLNQERGLREAVKGTAKQKNTGYENTKKCRRCGKSWHKSLEECPARGQKCHKCGKMGHFSNVCESKTVKKCQTENMHKESNLVKATRNKKGTRATVEVLLNDHKCQMEYDTGAGVSTINKRIWEKLGQPRLEPTADILVYGKKSLETLGTAELQVTFQEKTMQLPAVVVNTTDNPLFGLPWILAYELPIPEGVTVHKVRDDNNELPLIKESAEQIIERFSEIFDGNLGSIRGTKARIHVKADAKPVMIPARRTPFPLRKPVEVELKRLESIGVIEKIDPGITPIEWATPTVNVLKGDGTVRICGDFRVTLNPNLIPDVHLMPTFEDLTAKLVGGQEFSVIDLKDAYLQMEVESGSRKYLIISTHMGYFQYKRLPFGISCAPSIFQRYMEELLEGIPHTGVLLDDVIITGTSREEHLRNLEKVLEKLKTAGLRAKQSKVHLLQPSVTYLGHLIDSNGIHPTEEKVEAIRKTPSPTNVTELRSFLGAINFYERFVPNLHGECQGLHQLTSCKKPWKWTEEHQKTFEKVKLLLSSNSTVIPYDPELPLNVACDASEKGLGAVLSHTLEDGSERPIAFASRTLTEAEKRYAPIDREALALIFGVTKFNQYIYGRHFTLITDHKPLERIFGTQRDLPKVANNRLIRWALTLTGYDYTIRYRQGKENAAADALSRLPLPSTVQLGSEQITIHAVFKQNMEDMALTVHQLRQASRRDPTLGKVLRYMEQSWPTQRSQVVDPVKPYFDKRQELSHENGVVMWAGRIVIPQRLRPKVLKVLHEGHPGATAMRSIARLHVWWPHIDKDVEEHVKRCIACQENRENVMEVPLYSWNIPEKPWERLHADITGPFDGHYWLIVVDALSKWVEVEPMTKANATNITKLLREMFGRYGLPNQIVTDNGSQFTSNRFLKFCKSNGIYSIHTTPYHPKTNGLAERFVKTFKNRYRATLRDGVNRDVALQQVLLTYRTTPHKTTGVSPGELFFGRRIETLLDKAKPDVRRHTTQELLKQQFYHDKKSRVREFEPGDEVWVKDAQHHGWKPGQVDCRTGEHSYKVWIAGRLERKHADQLRPRSGATEEFPEARSVKASSVGRSVAA